LAQLELDDICNAEKMMDTEFASDWDVNGKEVLKRESI
jgi:hypothetical protein